MRILIVEDKALVALTLASSLEREGHEVIGPAPTSRRALQLGRDELPQLAFVDIDLEEKGVGLDVARQLYASCNCAVIFTTARPELARTCDCAIGLICKPYSFDDAVLAVQTAHSIMRGERPLASQVPRSLELLKSLGVGPEASALEPILLVEDHPCDAELTIAALEKCRIQNPVLVARDGVEALDYLEEHLDSNRPAVVLLDIKMPRMNGLEVLKRLRARSEYSSVPIVMLSASDHESDVRYCREHGANDYVVKPTNLDAFARELQRLSPHLSAQHRSIS
jgi:CheY-like chemotaxis protein